jgi:hypothetical protein
MQQLPMQAQQNQKRVQKLLTQLLQELSPMTPFHLKLYYLLADKNTQVGQTGSGGHHHHGGGHYSKNRGNNSG